MSAIDELVERVTKDLRNASKKITHTEARYLVDSYYVMQDQRIRLAGQLRSARQGNDDQPCTVLEWFLQNASRLESQVGLALKHYASAHEVGEWAMSICGVGPVISAGLLAHIDMDIAKTPGHIWSFAGLDPRAEWKKGEKRPWNADLKTLCWKIGESFVKVCNNEKDIYGKLYVQRKAKEQEKNEAGDYAEQAKEKLAKFKINKKTDAYKAYIQGKLPPGHVHARAKRWAVKIFLSHWWEVAYEAHHGTPPDFQPYPIAHLGHVHKIEVPRVEVA
jgi:hypothetical protein